VTDYSHQNYILNKRLEKLSWLGIIATLIIGAFIIAGNVNTFCGGCIQDYFNTTIDNGDKLCDS